MQLDFIKYNPMNNGNKLFSEFLNEQAGKDILLGIYSIITQSNRTIKVNLNKNWGDGQSLLGATIRYENFADSHNNILYVQDVYLDSPAHEAEIKPFKDYILGTREICFKSLDEFAKYIEVNLNQEIKLHVYNVDQG